MTTISTKKTIKGGEFLLEESRLQGRSRARRESVSGDDHSVDEASPGDLSVEAPRPRGQGSIETGGLAALFEGVRPGGQGGGAGAGLLTLAGGA